MAKNRKPKPTSNPTTTTAMDLDAPSNSIPHPPKSLLSAHTHAGISKHTRLPRGKGRRAQRIRKEKGAERAEEVLSRTERKVERSKGRGKRKGERNAAWEEMNKRIKGAVGEGKGLAKGDVDEKDGGEEEWVDEDGEEGKMLDVEGGGHGKGKRVRAEDTTMAAGNGEMGDQGEDVDDGIS